MGSERSRDAKSSEERSQTGESEGGAGGEPIESGGVGSKPSDGGVTVHEGTAEPLSIDDLFELLSRQGNRHALRCVTRADGPVPYRELVDHVVEAAGRPDGVSPTQFRNRIATRLVHSNLPKLDDAGLVDYDESEKTIGTTDATAAAVPFLELARDRGLES